MTDITDATEKHNPLVDAAELARTKKFSPTRFKALVRHYRSRVTDAEIVAAMAASPHLVDPIGRGR